MRNRGYTRLSVRSCVLAGLAILISAGAGANEDEWRWCVLDQGDEVLFAISNGQEGTDNFGLPLLSCKKKAGAVEVEGEAKENLRFAMADLIRSDGIPLIKVMPEPTPVGDATLDLQVNMLDGWRYKFLLGADHKAFERFRQSGVIEFKLAEVTVHEEFKSGLENVGKFFDLCRRSGN